MLEEYKELIEKCSRSSQDKFVHMPKSEKFATIRPTTAGRRFHAYSGEGQIITAYAYMQGYAKATPRMVDSIFSSTLCGADDIMRKTHLADSVPPFQLLFDFRKQLVDDGHAPKALTELVQALEHEGSHLGPRTDRTAWAQGLDITDARENKVDVLLHIGGSQAYDTEQHEELRFVVSLLEKAGVQFGFAYESESDSGGFAYSIGYREVAERYADQWQAIVEKSGAKTVLAFSAHDFASFKNIYPRMGKELAPTRILHPTEFIAELIRDGKLSLTMSGTGSFTYHDDSQIGRRSEPYTRWKGSYKYVLNTLFVSEPKRPINYGELGNYKAPRELLNLISGIDLIELERNRQFAVDCSAENGIAQVYQDVAELTALEVIAEVEHVGAQTIVTASEAAKRNLNLSLKKFGHSIKVTTVFDLLKNAQAEAQ